MCGCLLERLLGGRRWLQPVSGRFSANNGLLLLEAALSGCGLAILPTFLAGPHVLRGELERVTDAVVAEGGTKYAPHLVEWYNESYDANTTNVRRWRGGHGGPERDRGASPPRAARHAGRLIHQGAEP